MESESCTSPCTANTPCGAVPLRVMPATWYPWRTRRSAIASPMPRLAPVTTAVRAVCSLNAPLLTFGCCHTLARIAVAVLTTATSREDAAGHPACACEYPACACERSPHILAGAPHILAGARPGAPERGPETWPRRLRPPIRRRLEVCRRFIRSPLLGARTASRPERGSGAT